MTEMLSLVRSCPSSDTFQVVNALLGAEVTQGEASAYRKVY